MEKGPPPGALPRLTGHKNWAPISGPVFYARCMEIKALFEFELRLENLVDRLRIGLAAGLLHHLPDKPSQQPWLGLDRFHLSRIAGDDLINDLLDRPGIRNLFHATSFDDFRWIAAFRPDDLEQVLGNLARDF